MKDPRKKKRRNFRNPASHFHCRCDYCIEGFCHSDNARLIEAEDSILEYLSRGIYTLSRGKALPRKGNSFEQPEEATTIGSEEILS